jgi:hypothetical protein
MDNPAYTRRLTPFLDYQWPSKQGDPCYGQQLMQIRVTYDNLPFVLYKP